MHEWPPDLLLVFDVDGVLHPLNEKHLPADANYDEIIARGENLARRLTS